MYTAEVPHLCGFALVVVLLLVLALPQKGYVFAQPRARQMLWFSALLLMGSMLMTMAVHFEVHLVCWPLTVISAVPLLGAFVILASQVVDLIVAIIFCGFELLLPLPGGDDA